MKLGFFGINVGLCAIDPGLAVRVAQTAEASGWESVWTGEHYVLPDPPVAASPAPPETPMLDPFVALAHLAAHTTTLRLATGVTVVPLHQPLALAKRIASLDRVSGGRFLFGIGVGYLAPEFEALGVPLADRGARTEAYLDAMQAIWTEQAPRVDSRFATFDGVRAEPRPVQLPSPPVHVGGHVAGSFRRAVTHGHGWYGFALDLAATERALAGLRRAAEEHDRPGHLGTLEVSVTPDPRLTPDDTTIEAYGQLGVHRLVVLPRRSAQADPARLVAFVEELGQRVVAAAQ